MVKFSQEQMERMWTGCDRCKWEYDGEGITLYRLCDFDGGIGFESEEVIFCPRCGRPLTPAAREERRKRWEALNDGSTTD